MELFQTLREWRHEVATVFMLLFLLQVGRGGYRKTQLASGVALSMLAGAIASFAIYFDEFGREAKVSIEKFSILLVGYGATIYVLAVELLLTGAANWLNKIRGPRWIKELEYVYLFFGLCGLFVTINRLDVMDRKIPNLDLIGPLILVTAVVVKLIKTRAELDEWQKF